MNDLNQKIKISIVGGSGYAGGELLRILLGHPNVEIAQVTSRKFARFPVTVAHPNLRSRTELKFCTIEQLENCDLLFVALPNGESQKHIEMFKSLAGRIIDLGADYRLNSLESYNKWYGEHENAELLNDFVYGIAELHRDEIRGSNYVACAGCEATCSILTLYPLFKNGLVLEDRTIIDAKIGSSAAGGQASLSTHHPERSGVVRSYKPTMHRHTAEIEQELCLAVNQMELAGAKDEKRISETGIGEQVITNVDDQPFILNHSVRRIAQNNNVRVHLSATAIEMVRGILVTCQVFLKEDLSERDLWQIYRKEYGSESFIRLINDKMGLYRFPEPKLLEGTNYCDIGLEKDKRSNRVVIVGAIDNLVKGTAGQAIQAMNIMYSWEETLSLEFTGLHPI